MKMAFRSCIVCFSTTNMVAARAFQNMNQNMSTQNMNQKKRYIAQISKGKENIPNISIENVIKISDKNLNKNNYKHIKKNII